tara:strand:+ start:152 stop:388 length:237 start_codon:yes stop_codon:yes gene_type:complete
MISNFKFEAATDWQIEDDSWISKVCERFYIQVSSSIEYLLWEDTTAADGCYTHHKTCNSLKQAMTECHAMAEEDVYNG